MNARITPFQMKPEEVAGATSTLEGLKTRILALPGMQSFNLVVGEDGNGYVISFVDDDAVANPGTEEIKAIWAEVGKHLAAPPAAPSNFRVVASWQN